MADRAQIEHALREFAPDLAFDLEWNWGRRALLQALVQYLSDEQLFRFFIDVLGSLEDESALRALAALCHHLPDDLVVEASVVLEMDLAPFRRIRILTALAPRLSDPERSARMEELLGLVLSEVEQVPSEVDEKAEAWLTDRLFAGDARSLRECLPLPSLLPNAAIFARMSLRPTS